MILVSRSGRNPTVYIPNIALPHQPISSYFLAVDVLRAAEARGRLERRQEEVLRANPHWQAVCECGHHKYAHASGTGLCGARRCGCAEFREAAPSGRWSV